MNKPRLHFDFNGIFFQVCRLFLLGAFIFSVHPAAAELAPTPSPTPPPPNFVDHEVVVKFRDDMPRSASGVFKEKLPFSTFGAQGALLDQLISQYNILAVVPLVPRKNDRSALTVAELRADEQSYYAVAQLKFAKRQSRASAYGDFIPGPGRGFYHTYRLVLGEDTDTEAAARDLQKHPWIEYAEPNQLLSIAEAVTPPPADPQFVNGGLWHLNRINAPEAWKTSNGSGVTVAVVDSGIWTSAADLRANVWSNRSEVPADNLDNDGNGYADDIQGWDFGTEDNTITPEASDPVPYHGSFVSALIAAQANNQPGGELVGVAPRATIMPLKVTAIGGRISGTAVAAAIRYAALNGADIINASIGPNRGFQLSRVEEEAIHYATSLGTAVVRSSGNNGTNRDFILRRNSPGIFSIGATDENDKVTTFSDYGFLGDVVAPGWKVRSLTGSNSSDLKSGTSYSAPQVAGALALLLSNRPDFSLLELKQVLRISADDIEKPGTDYLAGAGRLNAGRATGIGFVPTIWIAEPTVAEDLVAGTGKYTVTGTVGGAVSYTLSISRHTNLPVWRVFATGGGTVQNGALGILSLSGYSPGNYLIKLTAVDLAGKSYETYARIQLRSALERRLSLSGNDEIEPVIYGNRVAWERQVSASSIGDRWRFVELYDLNSKVLSPVGSCGNAHPAITGLNLAFLENCSGIWDSSFRDFKASSALGHANSGYATAVRISNSWMLTSIQHSTGTSFWIDLVSNRLSGGATTAVPGASSIRIDPAISGNVAVWTSSVWGGTSNHIEGYDLALQKPIDILTLYDGSRINAIDISGPTVAYEITPPQSFTNIRLININSKKETTLPVTGFERRGPSISGSRVVYQDNRQGNWDIFMYDMATSFDTQLTFGIDTQVAPDTDGSSVVWADYRRGNSDIYFLPFPSPSPSPTPVPQ